MGISFFVYIRYYTKTMRLDHPIHTISGIGDIVAKRLAKLKIAHIFDLINHVPFRYEDYSTFVSVSELEHISIPVSVKVQIVQLRAHRSPRKRMWITDALCQDDTGVVRVVWFGQPYIAKNLQTGDSIILSGTPVMDMGGPQFVGPTYEKITTKTNGEVSRIDAVYHTTAGITQKQMRQYIRRVFEKVTEISDWIPVRIREKYHLLSAYEAYRIVHMPKNLSELAGAKYRFGFEELLRVQLLSIISKEFLHAHTAPQLKFHEPETKDFVAHLPFTLTNDQRKVAWAILSDLATKIPMNRMVQGDVGSGKTVVAALALLSVVLNKYQGAYMAPTEILATQVAQEYVRLFAPYHFKIALFTRTKRILFIDGSEQKLSKSKLIAAIKSHEIDMVIGTHALLSDEVVFDQLGLIVVDEQHRFGVRQRGKLRSSVSGNNSVTPHFLSMTATPIPRTYALAMYGDLAISTIREKPVGRKDIITKVIQAHERESVYAQMRTLIKLGQQAYVVCPIIAEDEEKILTNSDEKKSVISEYERLRKIFPDLRVSYMHGKMPAQEKNKTMDDFAAGEIDILISTSVIEVGVNVPNATIMLIEDADRFGLAQLHQFRGRVGRSDIQSYCFACTSSQSKNARTRLAYFESTTDGFKLAEYDLALRGPGEVFGDAQSGDFQFRFANVTDVELLEKVQAAAQEIDIMHDHALRAYIDSWEKQYHLE